ncbi:kynurenine formamidase [bacterium]|nr:kynurenine formamidase [bacterium]
MRIIDISPVLSESTPVWPGDTPLSRSWLTRLQDGSNIDLSTLTTTVHIGAHADAPSHYAKGAQTMEQVDLEPFLGPCVVVDARGCAQVTLDHCHPAIKSGARRILFKTRLRREGKQFETDFASFTPEAALAMGEAGVLLAGIDTSSVDPFDSKDLPAHQVFGRYNIRNLEGLDLMDVEPGPYELIALPLKLQGFDASPVRAILRKES